MLIKCSITKIIRIHRGPIGLYERINNVFATNTAYLSKYIESTCSCIDRNVFASPFRSDTRQLVCFVRFVSCPRTVVWAQARRVLPKWVHGRTGFTSNAHANGIAIHRRGVTMIILSRSLSTIQPIYRYPYYFLNLSHDFG